MAQPTEIEKVRRELKRKSLDQLKVYNPLEIPFKTIYDGYTYVVQPRKEASLLRYIAEKWMREFTDYMINTQEQEAVDKENARRLSKGFTAMNPQEKDEFDMRGQYMTNNPTKRLEFMKMVYKGISQEHGLDVPEATVTKKDRRPQDEQILAQLDKEMGLEYTQPTGDDFVEDKKEELLKDIS